METWQEDEVIPFLIIIEADGASLVILILAMFLGLKAVLGEHLHHGFDLFGAPS